MQQIKNQFKAEEKVITENLIKAGYSILVAMAMVEHLKIKSLDKKPDRNLMVREISVILRGNICNLRSWYAHDLIAKISGLSPDTTKRLSYTRSPFDIPKKEMVSTE